MNIEHCILSIYFSDRINWINRVVDYYAHNYPVNPVILSKKIF